MEFRNDLYQWRLLVMVGFVLCIFPPARSSDECSPYCVLALDMNTTQVDIRTPGYPSNYPQDTKLLWVIEAPSHCGMLLTVQDMDLAPGETVRFGYGDEARYTFKADDDIDVMINRTISFTRIDMMWVTFTSDSDNATARGFWLTVTNNSDAIECSSTSSPMPTLSTELPLLDLVPAVTRRLGVSLPLAVGLVVIAFGLGAGVVWCHRRRKRASVNARRSETRITLEMCDNPMTAVGRDVNLNTQHGSSGLGPGVHYYEIGEGEYNLLFGSSAPKSPHLYQELSKDRHDKDSGRSRSTVRLDESKGSLSAELDDEFCELTHMIDEMLSDAADSHSPVAASQKWLARCSPDIVRDEGCFTEQRSRAHTVDFPLTSQRPAFRPRSLDIDSVYPLPDQINASGPGMPSWKYSVSNPNISALDVKLIPGRSMESMLTNRGHNRNEDDNYSQLNFEIDPTYQPLACTTTVRTTAESHGERPGTHEYAVLEGDNPDDGSPVLLLTGSHHGSWEKVDIVGSPTLAGMTGQRPRAYTSDLPRRSDHYTALRSSSLLLESFPPFATRRQLLNRAAREKRIARSNPNVNFTGLQMWTNKLSKSSETFNKVLRASHDGLWSFAADERNEEDFDDDGDYNKIEDEESVYQPLSRFASMEDPTNTINQDNECTPPPLPPIKSEMSDKTGQNVSTVDRALGRELTLGTFQLVPEVDDDDNDDYNEIEEEDATYHLLSRPASMEDLTNGWSQDNEGKPPPLPPIQYEMNEKSGRSIPTVDVVLGRELTTVGSFHLVSTARRSDKMPSAVPKSSMSEDSNYDELDTEDNVELPAQTNPGNLYIEILEDTPEIPASAGAEHFTDDDALGMHHTLSPEGTNSPQTVPQASAVADSQDTARTVGGRGLNIGSPTEGALRSEPTFPCTRMINSNRFSFPPGVYSSIGPAGYEDDINNDDGIYNGIDSDSSDDGDLHEYISVDDVLDR